jgi:radical SAM protein with 4Fe4S-binding SPASM domain
MHPSLKSIELNITNKCNRSCSFCPQSQGFGGMDFMSIATVEKIAEDLQDYDQIITLAGFGEPLLNIDLEAIVRILKNHKLILITNGDAITQSRVESLIKAGLQYVKVSLYDYTNIENIKKCLHDEVEYDIMDYTIEPLYIVNRNEIFNDESKLTESKPCYLPSYKMFIDWDGEIRLCANDWRGVLSFGNVYDNHLNDIWLSDKFSKYRFEHRKYSPCNTCTVHGTLRGKESYKMLKRI